MFQPKTIQVIKCYSTTEYRDYSYSSSKIVPINTVYSEIHHTYHDHKKHVDIMILETKDGDTYSFDMVKELFEKINNELTLHGYINLTIKYSWSLVMYIEYDGHIANNTIVSMVLLQLTSSAIVLGIIAFVMYKSK